MGRWLNRIWPWSEIARLELEVEKYQRRSQFKANELAHEVTRRQLREADEAALAGRRPPMTDGDKAYVITRNFIRAGLF